MNVNPGAIGKGAAGVAGALALGFGGWALYQNTPTPLTEGRVTDRDFTPEHWEDYLRPVTRTRTVHDTECSTDANGNYSCRPVTRTETYTEMVRDTRWVNDDWDILIDGCSSSPNGDEHCREEWVDVSRAVYNDCQLGEHWREDSACRLR